MAWPEIELDTGMDTMPAVNVNADTQLWRQIVNELGATQAHQFLLISVKWAVLGGFVGLLVGALAVIASQKLGWYRSGWRFAGWVRWPLWILTVITCAGLVGGAGFFVGVIRGSERVMLHSQLATKVFPEVGDALADGMAAVQIYLSETNTAARSGTNISLRLETFRSGAWEVNAPEFLRQLDNLQAGAVSNVVADIEQKITSNSPSLQSGLPNQLLHHSLRLFGTMVVERKINSQLHRAKLDDFYHAFGDRLVAEARKHGAPDTIGHRELSAFLVTEAVVPGVMKPIRMFAGNQAKMLLFLAALGAVLPAAVFRFTCGRVQPAPAPTQPAGHRMPGS